VLSSGSFAISGIGLSAVVGVVLNLILPDKKAEWKLTNINVSWNY